MSFVKACRSSRENQRSSLATPLLVEELTNAENYWISHSQQDCFVSEIETLKLKQTLPSGSKLLSLRPLIDSDRILRVGGRWQLDIFCYTSSHIARQSSSHQAHSTKLIRVSATRRTHTPQFSSQSSVPHYWMPQDCTYYHPWLHCLSPTC